MSDSSEISPPANPHSTPGILPAWIGGALAAAGAASISLFLHGAPLGQHLWARLGLAPQLPVDAGLSFAAALAFGLGAAWVGAAVPPWRRVVGLLLAAALLSFSQSLILALHGQAWEPLPMVLAILGGGSIAALLRPELHLAGTPFRNRVSPAILTKLNAASDLSFLHPDQRDATVITCRLLNENALREVLPARDFLKLCSAFRLKAAAVLRSRGACLDPTEASGVRAFFGLPLPTLSPADDAVSAALALDDAMREFSAAHPTPAGNPACGIGLATGKLTAGLHGDTYSVLGDPVELSRWLAAETASYEVRLLTDAATHLAADGIEDRPLEFVNPPDGAAVEIFQLLGTTGSLSQEALARRHAFRDAIMLLRAGHAGDALARFADARAGLTVPDPPLDYFVALATDQSQRDAASTPATPTPVSREAAPAPLPPAPNSTPQSAALPLTPGPAAAPRRKGQSARKLPRRP